MLYELCKMLMVSPGSLIIIIIIIIINNNNNNKYDNNFFLHFFLNVIFLLNFSQIEN